MEDISLQVAREELAEWALLNERVSRSRDALFRRVLRAGLTKTEVHRATGVARTTIDRIAAEGFSTPDRQRVGNG